jgi:uncharacterized protein DUF4345
MNERRALQLAVALASLVPLLAGIAGIVLGAAMVGVDNAPIGAEGHFRYLSGLLLGIGVVFLASVPRIERHAARFRLLGLIVVIGGLARLLSLCLRGHPDAPMLFALVMELAVTPGLVLWQGRFAGRASP